MATTNVLTIPLYTKGYLTATGFREGCGYNVKLFWGTNLLCSAPSLQVAAERAYVGVRLKSPKFQDWMTDEMRFNILRELTEMGGLIFPKHLSKENDVLLRTLEKGMKWQLDNTLNLVLDPNDKQPEKTTQQVIDLLQSAFFKAPNLVVSIRMTSPFNELYDNDEFEVSLYEDKVSTGAYMSVTESHLECKLFNKHWIDNAKTSFNAYRRASVPDLPAQPLLDQQRVNPSILHQKTEIYDPQRLGVSPSAPRYSQGTGTPAELSLRSGTGDVAIHVGGSTVSFQASGNVDICAPQINVESGGAQGYTSDLFNGSHK